MWQLKYRCQSTAAATEASPGGFGGLFGCSWRWKIQLGRKKIFRIKKWAYGGPRLCPHMPFFYEKFFFSTRLAFCMLRTAKKAAKGTRACLRSSSSALATVIQLSTPPPGPILEVFGKLVPWCRSVHTAHRPAGGRVLCQGVLPGPVRPPTQRFSRLRSPYPALSLDEPAWGIPHLFPSGWVRMNQGTDPRVVRVPGGGRGLAPGQRPGTGGVS